MYSEGLARRRQLAEGNELTSGGLDRRRLGPVRLFRKGRRRDQPVARRWPPVGRRVAACAIRATQCRMSPTDPNRSCRSLGGAAEILFTFERF